MTNISCVQIIYSNNVKIAFVTYTIEQFPNILHLEFPT